MSNYDEEKIKEIDEELASGQDAYIGYEHDAVQDVGFLRCLLRNSEKQNKKLHEVLKDLSRAVNSNLDSAQLHFAGLNPLLIEVKQLLEKKQ